MTLVRMPDEEDWLFRPMLAGLCTYDDLVRGTHLDLGDVARMNTALDVKAENEKRLQRWYKEHPDDAD